jgi:hypothetical protein
MLAYADVCTPAYVCWRMLTEMITILVVVCCKRDLQASDGRTTLDCPANVGWDDWEVGKKTCELLPASFHKTPRMGKRGSVVKEVSKWCSTNFISPSKKNSCPWCVCARASPMSLFRGWRAGAGGMSQSVFEKQGAGSGSQGPELEGLGLDCETNADWMESEFFWGDVYWKKWYK